MARFLVFKTAPLAQLLAVTTIAVNEQMFF